MFALSRWRAAWAINRASVKMAEEVYPCLWENVRRKVATCTTRELTEYANVRAAQLCYAKLDQFMIADETRSGEFASSLIARSTARLVATVLAAVAVQTRRSAA